MLTLHDFEPSAELVRESCLRHHCYCLADFDRHLPRYHYQPARLAQAQWLCAWIVGLEALECRFH